MFLSHPAISNMIAVALWARSIAVALWARSALELGGLSGLVRGVVQMARRSQAVSVDRKKEQAEQGMREHVSGRGTVRD